MNVRFDPAPRVTSVSALTCAGDAAATWRALCEQTYALDPRPRLVANIDLDVVPPRQRRRMGRLSRLLVHVAHDALERAHARGQPDIGLVVGTGVGALDETARFLEQLRDGEAGSPALFAGSVMNVATGHVSMVLDLRGYNTTVNHHAASGELALMVAAQALAAGRAPAVLACGVDALEQRSLAAHGCVSLAAGALSQQRADVTPPGEQGAALLLAPSGAEVQLSAAASGRDALARCAASATRAPTLLLEEREAAASALPPSLARAAEGTSLRRICSAPALGHCMSAGAVRAAAAVHAIASGEHQAVLLRALSGPREVALLLERAPLRS
ncbi:MAG: beta-ketoacyl synthase chain length factor [Myxococcales bacterium]|nr:beta-ketoacyl synthase chain length factor [Myxococcales bacterium]